jgi:hypothetical protein
MGGVATRIRTPSKAILDGLHLFMPERPPSREVL